MKKIYYLFAAAFIFVAAACNSGSDEPSGRSQSKDLVSRIVYTNNLIVFEYDSQDRLNKVVDGAEIFRVSYPTATTMRTYKESNPDRIMEYTMTAKGAFTAFNILNDSSRYYTIEYDAQGYAKTMSEVYVNGNTRSVYSTTFVWKDGNLVSEVINYNTDLFYTVVYEYNPELLNNRTNVDMALFACWGAGFEMIDRLGVRSKNLLAKKTYLYPDNKLAEIYQYRYQLDGNGRIDKVYRKYNNEAETFRLRIEYLD